MYCVIVGDIEASRSNPITSKEIGTYDSEKMITMREKALNSINHQFAGVILSDFGIVRGDAFEGVIYTPAKAPQIIRALLREFANYDISIRVSAVADELTYISSARDKADGPAFVTAFQEVDRLKNTPHTRNEVQFSIKTNYIAQPLVDGIIGTIRALSSGWTDDQKQTVYAMECANHVPLVAARLGKGSGSIYKQLKASSYEAYHNAWNSLEQYFDSEDLHCIQSANPADNIKRKTQQAAVYYTFGIRKNRENSHEEAIPYFHAALELGKEIFEPSDFRFLAIYYGLAEAYLEQLDVCQRSLVSCAGEIYRNLRIRRCREDSDENKQQLTEMMAELENEYQDSEFMLEDELNGSDHAAMEVPSLSELEQIYLELQKRYNGIRKQYDSYLALADETIRRAENIANTAEPCLGIPQIHTVRGRYYFAVKQFPDALDSFNKAYNYLMNSRDFRGSYLVSECLGMKALTYNKMGKDNAAEELYLESISVSEKQGCIPRSLGRKYFSLGMFYKETQQLSKAYTMLKKAYDMLKNYVRKDDTVFARIAYELEHMKGA